MGITKDDVKKLTKTNMPEPKLVYNLPYVTEDDIKNANELRSSLYNDYNSVLVFPQGSWSVIIEASDKVIK